MATQNKPRGIGSRPKSEYEKKLVGLVNVVTGKTRAKFTLTEEGKTFASGDRSITVNMDDLPTRPKLKPEVKEPKQYRIRMSSDGSEIESITPAIGHFHAKLIDLGKRDGEDADPVPFEKPNFKGSEETHLEFWAVYEIVDGAFKGVQLPAYYLHYKFEEDPENPGYTRFAGNFENKKATRLFQLYEWGKVHGCWTSTPEDDEPIEWDDVTILPELLERALENDRLVDLTIKDGYIRELLPVQTDEEESDENPFGEEESDGDELDEAIDDFNKKSAKSKTVASKTSGKTPVKESDKKFVKKVTKKSSDEEDEL